MATTLPSLPLMLFKSPYSNPYPKIKLHQIKPPKKWRPILPSTPQNPRSPFHSPSPTSPTSSPAPTSDPSTTPSTRHLSRCRPPPPVAFLTGGGSWCATTWWGATSTTDGSRAATTPAPMPSGTGTWLTYLCTSRTIWWLSRRRAGRMPAILTGLRWAGHFSGYLFFSFVRLGKLQKTPWVIDALQFLDSIFFLNCYLIMAVRLHLTWPQRIFMIYLTYTHSMPCFSESGLS